MPRIQRWSMIIAMLIIATLLVTFIWMYQKNHDDSKQPKSPDHDTTTLWGVDTASKVNNSFYQCVNDNYGKPEILGRYMKDKKGVSKGLTQKEISFIHDHDGKILLIYNHFSNATGKKNGKSAAKQATSFANDLDAPKGVALFADIEPNYPVDADFIQAWTKKLNGSKFEPGIYGEFSKKSDSKLRTAYKSPANNIDQKPIVWSSLPRPGITSKDKAPDFNPAAPKSSKSFIWQYGLSAKKCSIDTDLIQSKSTDFLWK